MTVEINANSIIDMVMCEYDEIESFYRIFTKNGKRLYGFEAKNDKWKHYGSEYDKAYMRAYEKFDSARSKIYVVADVMGVHWAVVEEAALMARRWYNRTAWQKCLTEDEAIGLWELAVKNNTK